MLANSSLMKELLVLAIATLLAASASADQLITLINNRTFAITPPADGRISFEIVDVGVSAGGAAQFFIDDVSMTIAEGEISYLPLRLTATGASSGVSNPTGQILVRPAPDNFLTLRLFDEPNDVITVVSTNTISITGNNDNPVGIEIVSVSPLITGGEVAATYRFFGTTLDVVQGQVNTLPIQLISTGESGAINLQPAAGGFLSYRFLTDAEIDGANGVRVPPGDGTVNVVLETTTDLTQPFLPFQTTTIKQTEDNQYFRLSTELPQAE